MHAPIICNNYLLATDHEDDHSEIHSEYIHKPDKGGHLHRHTPKAPPRKRDFT